MKLTLIACAAAAALLSGASAAEPVTPDGWAAQLGAERLADREAASDALLKFGPDARDAVRHALDSTDPEVQSRAQELWKKLRWLVVADANDDIQKMVAEANQGAIDEAHWHDFVQKHGPESIRLAAEFRAAGYKPEIYLPGLRASLDDTVPMDLARTISQIDRSKGRAGVVALLDELTPDASEKTAVRWMEIQIALWNYEKAFDFGRAFSLRMPSDQVAKLCAIAADRGGLFDEIHDSANKEVASETDPGHLCVTLGFYASFFANTGKKALIAPLFDLARNTSTAHADDGSLRRLVESLLNAGLPDVAVKALHNVQSPLGLYMRSAADLQMQNEPTAGADWGDAMEALDEIDDAKKKEAYYGIGEVMHDWHDERAVVLWQKVLSISPATTVYDANACFRMGEYMEEHHQYGRAADFYEKGVELAPKTGGVMIVTGADGRSAGVGEQPVLEKIRQLKSQAAEEGKSIFNDQPAPENGGGTPR